jgi:hypothetical protein
MKAVPLLKIVTRLSTSVIFLSMLVPALVQAQVETAANLSPAPPAFTSPVEASPKRIMGVVPNFQTTNAKASDVPALTPKQKFILATHQSFDISSHVGNLFQSTLEQAGNGQPHYGEGWGAFGKRFAASEADQVTGAYLTYAVLPIVFHEDPRYFRLGHGPAPVRILYALSRSVITRRDSGGWTFNKSQPVGSFIAGEISTTYYPAQDRNLDGVALNCAVNLAYKGGFNVLSEYYPDLLTLLHGHKKVALSSAHERAS